MAETIEETRTYEVWAGNFRVHKAKLMMGPLIVGALTSDHLVRGFLKVFLGIPELGQEYAELRETIQRPGFEPHTRKIGKFFKIEEPRIPNRIRGELNMSSRRNVQLDFNRFPYDVVIYLPSMDVPEEFVADCAKQIIKSFPLMKLIVIESAPMSAYQMHRSEDDVQEPMLTRCLKTPKCEDDINIGTLEHPDLVQGLSGAFLRLEEIPYWRNDCLFVMTFVQSRTVDSDALSGFTKILDLPDLQFINYAWWSQDGKQDRLQRLAEVSNDYLA